MEKIKRMVQEFILTTVEQAKKPKVEPDRYQLISERLLTKHKVNEQLPYEYELEEGEWKSICRICNDVVKYKELENMKQYLVNSIISETVRHSKSMEDVQFNKATINGIELFFEEMSRLASLYRADIEEKKDADLNNLLDNLS